ncbi:hypothetical protein [Colwellia sp. PAMC 21821]|uniref:hypothetical protein n=1 Tax=Colwellia sp. PAMC 21821 TaxID=1816219 RepID=UPI0009BCE1F7|nr:hypothetical protein [Colwellia sp. PAMC 21821]ARD44264.1 hypothetical protein A3Q33_08015 [Colwellia sp. PAMC 21821]
MTVQKKLPSDIEENIQNLAGDIYLQIEDKITALLTSYSDNIEITPEIITTHPLFTALKEQHKSEQSQANKSLEDNNAELAALKAEQISQQSQLAKLQEDLSNAENLNSAKLTDSEQVLKDKLAENSQLSKQVSTLNQENSQQQQLLKEVGFEAENATKQLKDLATEKEALAKNDKAKAATLAVQNQQYSDLQLKFDQVSSELEYLKAEQEHKLLSSNEQLTHEQQQAGLLNAKVSDLQADIEAKQTLLDQQQENITHKEHENTDLTAKNKHLEQTIAQIEQNGIVAQQQYETQKQKINDKWLNEQEKNTQILKQSSDDNEQIIKQMHDAERHKQTLENELSDVKGELKAVNKQQLQVLDTVKTLEIQVEKEQAITSKLSEEKTSLEEALVQAEYEYNNTYGQQKQKITELTNELATIAIEHKSAQQSITNLDQTTQAQVEQISRLEQQVENEQLKFKQAIEKQNENHNQIVTGHQKALADNNAALSELQRQVDKTATELTHQLESKIALLATESTKLSELQLAHATVTENLAKIEHGLNEKQQLLTAVEAELAADRARTAKNRLLHQESKGKQEVEYNKARETIKYLRDENTELNRKLVQQVNELEDKLTEYRLRFEYAQKQLAKISK